MNDAKSIPEVPTGVLVLTGGVDVGEKTLNYEVVGWGKGRESWGIEYGILDGDPREEDVWRMLDRAVCHRVFACSDQKKMRVKRIAIDAGFAADFVYGYVKSRSPRCIATKGIGGLGKPFILGAGTVTKASRVRLQLLGVDAGKEEIVNRLRVEKPGPGYCHFPQLENGEPMRGYDETYFAGLKAEHREIRHKLGFRTYVWTKLPSQRNEPFDCRILALAALVMPSSGINLDTMSRDVFENQAAEADRASSPFGAQRMAGTENLLIEDFRIRRLIRPHVIGEQPPSPCGPCGELTSATGRLRGTAGKRLEFLILGKARRLTGNSAAMIRCFYRIPADCYSVVHVARQQFSCGLSSEEFLDGLSIKSQNSPRRTSHHTSIAL